MVGGVSMMVVDTMGGVGTVEVGTGGVTRTGITMGAVEMAGVINDVSGLWQDFDAEQQNTSAGASCYGYSSA